MHKTTLNNLLYIFSRYKTEKRVIAIYLSNDTLYKSMAAKNWKEKGSKLKNVCFICAKIYETVRWV